MLNLTQQQQKVICLVVFILMTGWAVKVYRQSLPAPSFPLVAPVP